MNEEGYMSWRCSSFKMWVWGPNTISPSHWRRRDYGKVIFQKSQENLWNTICFHIYYVIHSIFLCLKYHIRIMEESIRKWKFYSFHQAKNEPFWFSSFSGDSLWPWYSLTPQTIMPCPVNGLGSISVLQIISFLHMDPMFSSPAGGSACSFLCPDPDDPK